MRKTWIGVLILFVVLGFGFALDQGLIENPLGGVTSSAVKQDMVLNPEVKYALENLETTTGTICDTYPTIECLKLENPKEPFNSEKNPCLEWEDWKAKGCMEFDTKIGECLKWEREPECRTTETPIGITNIQINPTRKTSTQTCYSFKDTNGLLNIEEQCLDNSTTPEKYLETKLIALGNEKIAEDLDDKSKVPLPEPIEVVVK